MPRHDRNTELVQKFEQFFASYYDDAIKRLAQRYPANQRSLEIDWMELKRFDPDMADDYLAAPEELRRHAEEALRLYDLPIDVSLAQAHVRVLNVPSDETFYPGGFSPTDEKNSYRAITGEVSKATDVYAKVEEGAFECQRCGTLTRIAQSGDSFQEPHECQGCERQGPFELNFDQSEFIDGQTIQLQTPPDVGEGEGQTITVYLEDDLVGEDIGTGLGADDHVGPVFGVGDRITVSGVVRLEQKGSQQEQTVNFEPYVEGRAVEIEESNHTDITIAPDERTRIEAIANGEEGDPLDVAADSYHTKVYGNGSVKKALVLAIVGGATKTPGLRGEFHVLLIGDPSTGKSQLIEQMDAVAPKSVAASAVNTTSSGLTTTATRDEWGDGTWALESGAFVKANKGVLYIDELDDMSPEDRASMLDPMSKQRLHVSKAGINATLSTETSVVAAANPKHGRFDKYEPILDQINLKDNLLSRFDVVFTFQDTPNESGDLDVADHVTTFRDTEIRRARGEGLEGETDVVEGPISTDLLRKWLALAKRQPDPVYESEDVRETLRDSFVSLRGLHGFDEDGPVPVTFRKLPGVERVARSVAKLELSEVVTERHARAAIELVGESIHDYQQDENGNLDADAVETGTTKSQHDRMTVLKKSIKSLQGDYERSEGVPREEVIDYAREEYGVAAGEDTLHSDMDKMQKEKGTATEPTLGNIRFIGGR